MTKLLKENEMTIELKDPALAAFLAWLIPGLGHWYQGRIAKGILYFVCILGTFSYGVYLGGNSELGWGRVVYVSFRPGDMRLPYLCQVCVSLPALPALVQANRVRNGKEPLAGGFMAPPSLAGGGFDRFGDRDRNEQPTIHALHKELHRYFELGTVYTMIAGLLNVLAIYDAWGGPVFSEEDEEDDGETPEPSKDDPPASETAES